jgi:hypothetical protein
MPASNVIIKTLKVSRYMGVQVFERLAVGEGEDEEDGVGIVVANLHIANVIGTMM